MILVPGTTGTVGSAVVGALLANKEPFKAETKSAEPLTDRSLQFKT
jgi:uncharacterized protein YbjT (DUF2867 family)